MPDHIFICYRRDDSAGHAGRVHDRLESEFGRDLLFMDVDSIPLGANFVKVLREAVATCQILLAVIGPNWLNARDRDGARKIDDPNDFVRIEIGAALQRDIPVIPILLDDTALPRADQLPEEMRDLSVRQALRVRHDTFHADMNRLVIGLKKLPHRDTVEDKHPGAFFIHPQPIRIEPKRTAGGKDLDEAGADSSETVLSRTDGRYKSSGSSGGPQPNPRHAIDEVKSREVIILDPMKIYPRLNEAKTIENWPDTKIRDRAGLSYWGKKFYPKKGDKGRILGRVTLSGQEITLVGIGDFVVGIHPTGITETG